jgi:hypothetical protein
MKLDPSGNRTWAKTFGGSDTEWVGSYNSSVQQTSDGGYVIAGRTHTYGGGNTDVLLLKLDSSGNRVWAKTFGGSGSEAVESIQKTSDGRYVVSGWSDASVSHANVLILKMDSDGSIQSCSSCQDVPAKATVDVPTAKVTVDIPAKTTTDVTPTRETLDVPGGAVVEVVPASEVTVCPQ